MHCMGIHKILVFFFVSLYVVLYALMDRICLALNIELSIKLNAYYLNRIKQEYEQNRRIKEYVRQNEKSSTNE